MIADDRQNRAQTGDNQWRGSVRTPIGQSEGNHIEEPRGEPQPHVSIDEKDDSKQDGNPNG